MSDRTDLLRNMFTDRLFKRLDFWLWRGVIDNAKIAVVVATLNPGFFQYALNKGMTERVLAALRNGRADEGYTVFAESNGLFQQFTYTGHRDAEELYQKILAMGLQTRMGRFGEFWQLPSILTLSEDDAM